MQLKDIKNWSPEIEKPITEKWKKENFFKFDPKTKKQIYSIDTPPPYVNAPIHIGHATTYCYMDFFARYKRLKGFEVLFPMGLDRNGLPIEVAAEKKFKVSPFKISRQEFLEYCKKILEEMSSNSADSFSKLGISFSSYDKTGEVGSAYFTDDDSYRTLTQSTFIDLFKKNLVYQDVRINNWDSKLQTTIADSEIEYEEKQTKFNYVKWKLKETGEEIIIGTTRPELICTCGMVIYNPEDKRYAHLDGQTAISPLFGKEVPIQAHPLAQIDKGSGLVMMCSAGDVTDIQFFRSEGLTPVIAISQDGKMNQNAGFLEGLKVAEAREKTIKKLEKENLLDSQEDITHRTPISERSKVDVEFIEMQEFYVKQLEFKDEIKKLSDSINFYPETSRKILHDWIDSIAIDWPVSRRRFYSTEVPLWYAEYKGTIITALPPKGKYYKPWNESVPVNSEIYLNDKKIGNLEDKEFQNLDWYGEERVFDTWFDSSISCLNILNYNQENSIFDKSFPVTLRPQGKEIVRTWLYYTLLRSYHETGKMPFQDAWIHQHILDGKGIKMSKSLGNVIDPQDLLKEFGAEAFRFWAATEGDLSKTDLRCSKDRIRAELKTLNKILNVSKFVNLFDKPEEPELTNLDQLFIDFIEDLTNEADRNYSMYDFYHPATQLRYFIWEIFASNYIELVKARTYNQDNEFSEQESNSAKYTLHFLLERFLLLLHPINPQITSLILENKGIDIFSQEFPEPKEIKSDLTLIPKLMEFNSEVWKQKKEKGISLRNSIEGIKIPKELKPFEQDLIKTHKLL